MSGVKGAPGVLNRQRSTVLGDGDMSIRYIVRTAIYMITRAIISTVVLHSLVLYSLYCTIKVVHWEVL